MNDTSDGGSASVTHPAASPLSKSRLLYSWYMVGVFCLAALVSYTDRLVLSALVDPIKHTLRVDDASVSLLQGAAFALVYVFSGLLLGRLADKRRRLTILIIGSSVWCGGTISCGLAPSFWALFAARVVVGVGEAALAPAAVSIISDSFSPSRRGAALGVFMFGFALGGPASIAVGSVMLASANAGTFSGFPLLGAMEPWRIVLVIMGLAGFAVPSLFLTLQEPARRASEPQLSVHSMVRRLAVDRYSLVPAYLAMGLLSIGDYGMLAWAPSALSRHFSMPLAELGWNFGAVTIGAGMLGCVCGGTGSDFFASWSGTRGRLFFSLGAAIIASAGAALVSSTHISAVFSGVGLWTFGSMLAAISTIAAVQDIVPSEYRGVGIAVVAFCNTLLGLGLGPTLVALITDYLFRDPQFVAQAITTTALPAGTAAAILLFYASRTATGHDQRA